MGSEFERLLRNAVDTWVTPSAIPSGILFTDGRPRQELDRKGRPIKDVDVEVVEPKALPKP